MTSFRKLCNQKSVAFFNQVRSLLFAREVCYNDYFHKSTLYTNNVKGQFNFLKRTFFTKNELDNENKFKGIIEGVGELEDLSKVKEFSLNSIKDGMIDKEPIISNTKWSRLEIKVLDSLVEKHGEDWELVSQYMFDKSPQECKIKYESIKIQPYSTTFTEGFTDDEIDHLNNLIRKHGRNWRMIAKMFHGKKALDIESFVNNNPDKFPSLYRSPISIKRYGGSAWTDDELKSLNELLIKYGRNFDAISEELPGRTPKAVERTISKRMLSLPALHSGKVSEWFRSSTIWSESEIRLLNELIEVYGFNWEKISDYLPGRSPTSCSTKFYTSWSTWNHKATALVPHKWPKEVLEFLDLLIKKYGKWQIIPVLVPGLTPANWFSPFFPQSRGWTTDEKLILQYLIKTHGYNWEKISEYFPHRQRWTIIREVLGNIEDYESTHKDQEISISKLIMPKKRKRRCSYWSYEEVEKLYELKEKYSSNWYKISNELPGRNPASCYLKDFVLLSACKELNNKLSALEICHLQELLRDHGTKWETIAKHINKDPNEIKDIVNEYPRIFPPVIFGSQIKNTGHWSKKEQELFKNLVAVHGNNWKYIKNFFPKKSYKQMFEYYYKNQENFPHEYSLNTKYWIFNRATWKKEENELLKELLQKYGDDFEYIARHFPDRSSSAIKAHVRNFPELFYTENEQNYRIESKHKKYQKTSNMIWTKEEVNKLLELTKSNPINWDSIAAKIPYRSAIACKAKYRTLIKPEMTVPRFSDTYEVLQD
ncbi:hypothetical protein C1645_502201 [Glomus cerebriforme]|uniref:Homeodomain-like protein n=1 Tax=Glomus cerebriforme TaxID=658196 RepID=A0A397SI80_9GLOM|nr:hypothetical protein C1645_502201 [Glomus cerebriforme]